MGKKIQAAGFQDKIAIKDLNTLGALTNAWNDGYRNLGLEVYFNWDRSCLGIGSTTGTCLQDFFKSIDSSRVGKIWLELRGVNGKNCKRISSLLEADKTLLLLKEKIEFTMMSAEGCSELNKLPERLDHHIEVPSLHLKSLDFLSQYEQVLKDAVYRNAKTIFVKYESPFQSDDE